MQIKLCIALGMCQAEETWSNVFAPDGVKIYIYVHVPRK